MIGAGTPIKQETGETKILRTLTVLGKLVKPITLVKLGKQKIQAPSAQLLRVNVDIARFLRPLYLLSFSSVLTVTSILRLLSIQHSGGMESMQFKTAPAMTYA
jgi:hypothetical protein